MPSNTPRESSVEASIVAYAKKLGVWTRKFTSPSNAGVPDRIFLHRGNVLFLEVKRPGGRPTKLQEYTMNEMMCNGARVSWVDSAAAGRQVLDQLVRRPPA